VTIVFLKNSNISGIFPSAILTAAGVREEEVTGAIISAPESLLVLSLAC
jgi:hypothetical protein